MLFSTFDSPNLELHCFRGKGIGEKIRHQPYIEPFGIY